MGLGASKEEALLLLKSLLGDCWEDNKVRRLDPKP